MIQLAMAFIGLAGGIILFDTLSNKKQVLNPAIVRKVGPQKARIISIILGIVLIIVALIGLFTPIILKS
jgi:hypothetical protein